MRPTGPVRRLLGWAFVSGAAAGGVAAFAVHRGRHAGPRIWPGDSRAFAEATRLRRREDELLGHLDALDAAQTDFMSTVSHELRTPLTSIAGYAELLRDAEPGELSQAQLRMVEAISRNARRLRELVEDILTQSKIESGGFDSKPEPVDLAQLVGRVVTAMEPAAARASVGLRAEVHGPLPLRGDGVQLNRVLTNLIGNAVKFTPADGSVTVRAERRDDQAVLVVVDTGMGIPAGEQKALFGRFFRATNAMHHAVPGAGLGLAISRRIVHNHGGTIDVLSTENVGTTVTVRLPAG